MTPSQLRGVPWSLAFLAVILAIIVLVQGERHDRLALASALSTGLVLAVVVTAWEVGRRRTEQALAGELESQRVEAADRKRRAIQRTLTLFIGHALSNIASQVQLVGVDENGEPIELFLDISQALRAFETHKGTERVMAQVGLVTASEKYPPQSLVLNAWDSIDRFYFWLNSQFQAMLSFFAESGEERSVDALLELRRLEYSHRTVGNLLWKQGEPKGWTQTMTDNRAQWAAYSTQVIQPVLLRYAELLRAIEGVPSGIAQLPTGD